MYEKILVTLDGSELAEVALPYAEEIATRLGSTIKLVYVSESKDDQYRNMQESYIHNLIERLQQTSLKSGSVAVKPLKLEPVILTGNPADEIVDYAFQEKVGVIFMSTHGRTGIRQLTIGSVASRVLKDAMQPVALIRAKGSSVDMRKKDLLDKVLVPLDGSPASEVVLSYMEELASKLNIELNFIQVLQLEYMVTTQTQIKQLQSLRDSAKTYIENIAARFKKKGIAASGEFREASDEHNGIVGEIMKAAEETQADMIAMSSRGRAASDERPGERITTLESIVKEMLHSGNTPLFLVKPLWK
jgi:nucleotide-binding universal stress UspA family protein